MSENCKQILLDLDAKISIINYIKMETVYGLFIAESC